MPGDNPEINHHREGFEPSRATLDAWESQAHMLEFRNSPRGSEQALQAQRMAQDAFACVIEATEENIFNAIIGLTKRNSQDSRDILQEVYIRAYKYLPSFRGDAQIETWLNRIMVNSVNAYYNKLNDQKSKTISLPIDTDSDRDQLANIPSTDPTLDPVWNAEHTELNEKLMEAISQLSPKLGRAAILYFSRDLNYEQIGKILGEAANTIKQRVNRARKKLRNHPELKKFHNDKNSQEDS